MRITNGYQAAAIDRVAPAKPVEATAKTGATDKTGGASSILDVNVSSEATARAASLEALKKSVQDGSFKVDPDAIAAKLVGE
jgi:anti-sigma28 factor (negative regulator of flagellin synthesis)